MDLREFARLLRRNILVIICVVLVAAIAGLAVSLIQTPRYEATAKLYVSISSAATVQDLSQGGTFAQQVVTSYADVAVTPYVLQDVADSLGLNESALAKSVSATALADTSLLQISVTDTSAPRAASIANAVAVELSSAVDSLTPDSAASSGAVKITQIQQATVSTSPVSPVIGLNIGIGVLVGLIVALAYVLLRNVFDTRLRDAREMETASVKAVLSTTPYDAEARTTPLAVGQGVPKRTLRGESFRTLRTNLKFLNFSSGTRSIVVTSSLAGEGKSATAVNLAIALAEAGESVVLVDADLRRPRVAEYLGIDGGLGLTDVLIGDCSLDQALQTWGSGGLQVLSAGQVPPNPSELLQGDAAAILMTKLAERFGTVIYDTPPVLPVSDASILAARSDGAIVVSAIGRTRKADLAETCVILAGVGGTVLGLVATMAPVRGPDAVRYGRYYYGSSEDGQTTSSLPAVVRNGADGSADEAI